MDYSMLKHSHMGFAYLSILLFVLRFVGFYFAPVLRRYKLLRILPHVIDTLLLVTAIILCVQIAQYPLTHHWLTAKVVGLVGFIGLGVVAMRQANRAAFVGAVLCFVYVLGVAKAKNPMSWLLFM